MGFQTRSRSGRSRSVQRSVELPMKDNFYFSEEAGLTPLLAMTQSFEVCDWLVVQEGSKSAFKSRVYYKPSL